MTYVGRGRGGHFCPSTPSFLRNACFLPISYVYSQYGVQEWGMYEGRLRQTGLVGDRGAAMAHMEVSPQEKE